MRSPPSNSRCCYRGSSRVRSTGGSATSGANRSPVSRTASRSHRPWSNVSQGRAHRAISVDHRRCHPDAGLFDRVLRDRSADAGDQRCADRITSSIRIDSTSNRGSTSQEAEARGSHRPEGTRTSACQPVIHGRLIARTVPIHSFQFTRRYHRKLRHHKALRLLANAAKRLLLPRTGQAGSPAGERDERSLENRTGGRW